MTLNQQLDIAEVARLYADKQIQGLVSEKDLVKHMYDKFRKFFCIKYAIVNSWAMVAFPAG